MESLVQLRARARDHVPPAGNAQLNARGRPLTDPQARTIRYLRVSLTDRCNYRCTYCIPERALAYGRRADVLSLEEVEQACRAFAHWGVRKVRLTGGEPTLRRGLVELIGRLRAIPSDEGRPLAVHMTTNGERLAALAAPLRRAGLSGITVSLDTLDRERFAAITRRGRLDAVVAGIDAVQAAGFERCHLNTVAIADYNDHELGEIARFAWSRGFVPRFIEVMPMSGGELYVPGGAMSAAQVRNRLSRALEATLVPDDEASNADPTAGPARYDRVVGGVHHGRRLGLIAPMTENFCGSCNRLRLSATGQLHACLARDETGDLRAALRGGSPDALERVVRGVLGTKRNAHEFNRDGTGGPSKTMMSIGG